MPKPQQAQPGQILTKKCNKCGEVKPHSDFYKDASMSDGIMGKCKNCHINAVVSRSNSLDDATYLWRIAKQRAKRMGREFAITIDDVKAVDTDLCSVLKIPIKRYPQGELKSAQPDAKSLDRIDPTKGYIPGNIRVISFRANTLLSNQTQEEARLIYLSYQSTNP